MTDYKLPIRKTKKIQFKTTRVLTLYDRNRYKLGLLPKVFISIAGIAAIFFLSFYLNLFGMKDSFGQLSEESRNKSPEELVANSKVKNSTPSESVTKKIKPTTITIINSSSQSCELTLSESSPKEITSEVQGRVEGWWLPTNCQSDIQAIQIIELKEQQTSEIQKTSYQKLDDQEPAIYALTYTNTFSKKPDYKLQRYKQNLVNPIYPNRGYFNPASSWDTRIIGNQTYYLTKGCQGGLASVCSLWKLDKQTNQLEFLEKDLGSSYRNLNGRLPNELYIKFADSQDFPKGVNVIAYNRTQRSLELLRFNASLAKIEETKEIEKGDLGFDLYYR